MRNLLRIFLVVVSISVFADNDPVDVKAMFWDAETFFYEKDYKEALTIYNNIVRSGTENANIDYRIGICYLKGYHKNSDKVKAIRYLEKAVQSVTKDYKEGEITEVQAHEDAYIYLADAYAINNELDKAIKTYNDFKDITGTTDKYYLNIVNRKIETCESAKKLETLSIKFSLKNLGKNINNKFANYNALLSGDGQMLVYTTDMKFYEAVFYSKKVNGEFSIPRNFNIDAQVEGSVRSVGISYDGKELYLFKDGDDEGKGDIYVSTFDGSKWSKIKKLNKNINSSDLERHASPSKDGNVLYFTSNRKGGYGSLDIYKSIRQADGEWGKAINLGDKINTKFDEVSPFILSDNKTLYFSSQGHYYNMGQNDLFMSQLQEDSTWSTPLNFGYPLNTTDEDKFLYPTSENGKALISLASEDGFGDLDVYEVTFYPQETPSVLLKGKLDNKAKEISVKVTANGEAVKEAKSDKDGNISIQVPSGDIKLAFSAEDMESAEKNFDIPKVYCLAEIDLSDVKFKHTNTSDISDKNNDASGANGTKTTNGGNVVETVAPAILFGFDKAIPDRYKDELDKLAVYLNNCNNILIEIAGYADAQGDEAYNVMLTEKRANFVKTYLVSKGVDATKLKAVGYGEKYPVSIDLNPESRKYNRRVQFKIIRDELGKLKVLLPEIPDKYKIK